MISQKKTFPPGNVNGGKLSPRNARGAGEEKGLRFGRCTPARLPRGYNMGYSQIVINQTCKQSTKGGNLILCAIVNYSNNFSFSGKRICFMIFQDNRTKQPRTL